MICRVLINRLPPQDTAEGNNRHIALLLLHVVHIDVFRLVAVFFSSSSIASASMTSSLSLSNLRILIETVPLDAARAKR
jgi:hypothetical protein